jgi:DNA-binding beta-propeller fold protein YncE
MRILRTDASGRPLFNYPTFATVTPGNEVLVNDGLNYQIKRFDSEGNLLGAFGEEGDGPGTFSRPKGIAVDSDLNIYVVDNLFDNVQIFDRSGRVLLSVGSGGDGTGQFWSPAGIDIQNDTVYVADTHNHRVQILHYLGDKP